MQECRTRLSLSDCNHHGTISTILLYLLTAVPVRIQTMLLKKFALKVDDVFGGFSPPNSVSNNLVNDLGSMLLLLESTRILVYIQTVGSEYMFV